MLEAVSKNILYSTKAVYQNLWVSHICSPGPFHETWGKKDQEFSDMRGFGVQCPSILHGGWEGSATATSSQGDFSQKPSRDKE